jgi:hypothetical protein
MVRHVAVATAALGVVTAGAVVVDSGGEQRATAVAPARLAATSSVATAPLHPGAVVTGVLEVENLASEPARLGDVVLASATSDACTTTGVALAPTIPPTPEAPLEVPAEGTATLEWTAYMDGTGDDACQGATLTSQVLLDGTPAGTVTLTAGTLDQPPAPVGGLTTSTRAAVHWSASTAADPGWVVERAVAGTDDWQPACGSSPARPVRTLTCTDTGLTGGTAYVYRVTLRTGHWHMTSRPSAPVTTQDRSST